MRDVVPVCHVAYLNSVERVVCVRRGYWCVIKRFETATLTYDLSGDATDGAGDDVSQCLLPPCC